MERLARKIFSYENRLLLILGLAFGLVFFDRQAASILAPFIQKDLALDNTQIGLLTSVLALSWALSAYVISRWSDAVGRRKPFLIAFVIIFSACSVASGLAHSFPSLVAARLLMGVVEGPFLPICLAIMTMESSPTRRALNAGVMQNLFSALLGNGLAAIILVALAVRFGWRSAFYLSALPGLLIALALWLWVRERAHPPIPTRAEEAADGGAGLLVLLRNHNVRVCAVLSILMVGWLLIGSSFLPVFLTSARHMAPAQMSHIMFLLGLCAALSAFVAPPLSDRFGRRPVMIGFCALSAVAPLTAVFFTGPEWAFAALMFVGWAGTGVFPMFMGVIPGESLSPRHATTAMGLVICAGETIGGFAGPLLAGAAADRTSLAAPMAISAACALAAALVALLLIETAPARRPAQSNMHEDLV